MRTSVQNGRTNVFLQVIDIIIINVCKGRAFHFNWLKMVCWRIHIVTFKLVCHCRDCGTDPTCVLCMDCFQNGEHRKHRYRVSLECWLSLINFNDLINPSYYIIQWLLKKQSLLINYNMCTEQNHKTKGKSTIIINILHTFCGEEKSHTLEKSGKWPWIIHVHSSGCLL